MGEQPYGTCGEKEMTFEYKFCNLNSNTNVVPVARAPASGDIGTQAMFRQREGFPELILSPMGPGVCRTKKIVEKVNTCKRRVVGSIRFEGWYVLATYFVMLLYSSNNKFPDPNIDFFLRQKG